MMLKALLPALVAMSAASAALADPDPYLGAAVLADERAQIIDLHPHYRGDPAEGSNGLKAVRAITRYRLDREKPLTLPTSDTKSGAQGTAVNGTGESQNGSQVLSGDNASGSGSTGQSVQGGSNGSGSSGSRSSPGGPMGR